MFKRLKQKREIRKQNRLIKLAEENGIELPPAYRPAGNENPTRVDLKNTIYRWSNPRRMRAKIAEGKLKEKGIL